MTVSQFGRGSVRPQPSASADGRDGDQNRPSQADRPLPAQQASTACECAAGERRHVLLAEDDDEMRALLAWWLRKDGFDVTECDHGIDLINRIDPLDVFAESEVFDLIISDIRMPGITGLEVLEDVRHCRTECPPVILITAFGDKETHEQACRLGAAAMFDKPFEFSDLLAKVHELVSLPSSPDAGIAVQRPPVEFPTRSDSSPVPENRKGQP